MLVSASRPIVGQPEYRIRHPSLEILIIRELLEEFGIILEQIRHHAPQSLVVLNAGVLPVGVHPGIFVGQVVFHAVRDVPE